jgi:hypothetical protein
MYHLATLTIKKTQSNLRSSLVPIWAKRTSGTDVTILKIVSPKEFGGKFGVFVLGTP